MAKGLMAALLVLHQLVYSTQLQDSFFLPKWVFFSLGFTLLAASLVFRSWPNQSDLKYPKGVQALFVFVLAIPPLVQFFHSIKLGNYDFLHFLGISCTFYVLPYLMARGLALEASFAQIMIYLISNLILLDYFGLLPAFQGSQYHLSALAGNPNLSATSLFLWYLIFRLLIQEKANQDGATEGSKGSVSHDTGFRRHFFESVLVFVVLCLTMCRAVLLVFLIFEIVVWLKENASSKSAYILNGLIAFSVLGTLLFFMVKNPYKWEEFSRLSVRVHELKITTKMVASNLWTGIPVGQYRNAYFDELIADKDPQRDPMTPMSLSNDGHFGLANVFLYLGLPLGILWLLSFFVLIFYCSKSTSYLFPFGVACILVVNQSYFIFKYSLALIPFLLMISHVLSRQLKSSDSSSMRRFLPLVFLILWSVYWARQLQIEYRNSHITSFEQWRSYHQNGELDPKREHLGVEILLASGDKMALSAASSYLEKAQQRFRDPVYYYHKAMIYRLHGDEEKAREILLEGRSVMSSYAPYYYGLSLLSRDLEKEEYYLRKAIELRYDYFSAWKNYLILVMKDPSRQEEAKSVYQQVLALERSNKGSLKMNTKLKIQRVLGLGI